MKSVLEGIVTPSYVSDTIMDLRAYAFDASGEIALPKCVVWPGDIDELRKILLRTSTSKFPIVVRGFGTNLIGATIANNFIVLEMTRMGNILKLDRRKALLTVEAGCSLAKINTFLKKHSLYFPVQPAHDHHTMGGLFACNALGSLSMNYGRFAEQVERFEFFDATGKFHESKDAARFAGTEGTCVIATQFTLKVIKEPKIKTMDVFKETELHDLLAKIEDLKKNPEVLRMEFLDVFSAEMLGFAENYVLLVAYEDDTGSLQDDQHIREYWEKHNELSNILSLKGFIHMEDVSIPTGRIYDMVKWCEERELPCFGPIGLQIIYTMLKDKEMRADWYRFARDANGDVAGAFGIGLKKKAFANKDWKERIKILKEQYDYHNLFNPGKIIEYR